MASINKRNWGNIKPPLGAQIDWGHELAQGLDGCFLFNECGGGLVFNLVTNKYGSFGSGATRKIEQSSVVDLDGATGVIDLGNIGNYTTEDFTIAFRVKLDVFTYPVLFSRGTINVDGYYLTCGAAYTGLIFSQSGAFQNLQITPPLIDDAGVWLSLVFIRKGSTADGYRNGTLMTSNATSLINPSPHAGNFLLGSYSGSSYTDGQFEYCYIWRRSLESTEAKQLYQEPYAFIQAPSARQYFLPTTTPTTSPIIARSSRKRSWGNVKPPLGAQIDWSHPLSQGLMVCIMQHVGCPPLDLVSNKIATIFSGSSPVYKQSVEGDTLGGSLSYRFDAQTGLDRITTEGSLFCVGTADNDAFAFHIGSFDIVSGDSAIGIGFDDNVGFAPNSPLGMVGNQNVGASIGNLLGTDFELRFHRIGFTFNSSTAIFYVRGNPYASTGFSLGTPPASADRRTQMFTNIHSGVQNAQSTNSVIYAWDKQLTDAEMAQLYREPYCFIQAPSARQYFFMNAAGGWGRLFSRERNRLVVHS